MKKKKKSKQRNAVPLHATNGKRRRIFPRPDIFLKNVGLRHTADKQELLPKLEKSLRARGWDGRPLLVLWWQGKNGDREYETVTGCHRAQAAMKLGIKIPCVLIPKAQFKRANMMEYAALGSLLQKAEFRKAARLARLEVELGSTAKPVEPTKRPFAGSKKFGITRVVESAQERTEP
jgi:hypothetical protein